MLGSSYAYLRIESMTGCISRASSIAIHFTLQLNEFLRLCGYLDPLKFAHRASRHGKEFVVSILATADNFKFY
jgi:hypothetical protein